MFPAAAALGWAVLVYIGIVLVGYFYIWKKGALDWGEPAARRGEV